MMTILLAATVMLIVSNPVRSDAQKPSMTTLQGDPRAFTSSFIDLAVAQEEGWAAIKSDAGLLFVWNARGLYFTLSINGKEIKPMEDPEHIFFNVDGRVLQIQLAEISSFAPDAREKKLDDKSILAAHRDWEAKFIEGALNSKLKVQAFNAKLSSGSDASMWQFDMPESINSDAKKQLYLTIVSGDYVLLLNSVATATISDAEGRKFLLDTMATLKVSPIPIDVKKLSESIRKSAAP
jgi:hypothetical protein